MYLLIGTTLAHFADYWYTCRHTWGMPDVMVYFRYTFSILNITLSIKM